MSTSALHQLQAPDGYYKYLNVPKPSPSPSATSSFLHNTSNDNNSPPNSNSSSSIDVEKVEKNYRRLSLKHHPDRPNGDADTFRLLKRAKYVLLTEKLRNEYDLLGLDLEEDEEGEDHQEEEKNDNSGENTSQDGGDGDDDAGNSGGKAGGDTVISVMASTVIAGIFQLTIRTAFMGLVSTLLTRIKYLLYPTILFLFYTSYKIFTVHYTQKPSPMATKADVASPLIIALSMYMMYTGRDFPSELFWTYQFWIGETTVMTLFILNSLTNNGTTPFRPTLPVTMGYGILSMLVTLWTRGKFWRYGTLVSIELAFALAAVLIFPMMEMVLEEIMRDKMKKVGEKVRSYAAALEKEMEKNSNIGDIGVGLDDLSGVGGGSTSGPKKRYGTVRSSGSGDID